MYPFQIEPWPLGLSGRRSGSSMALGYRLCTWTPRLGGKTPAHRKAPFRYVRMRLRPRARRNRRPLPLQGPLTLFNLGRGS